MDSMQTSDPLVECKKIVADFFKYDDLKIKMWWTSANPLLGNVPPEFMVKAGRSDKLLKVIRGWRAGN